MAVQVETLDKLERRITLSLPAATIASEVESRLRRLSRTVKADGFRPGKVPMSVVSQRYGYSVHSEVLNDKVGQVFSEAVNEAKLRVAGPPRITEKEGAPEGEVAFDATFEVYPEVKIGDLAAAEVERVTTEVGDAAVDKTLDILRKQRRTFQQRPAGEPAAVGDRVTIDFAGTVDGVPFEGGKAEGFQFIIGEGQMLEQFDAAVRGMKSGDSKTFPLQFPADYQGKDVAGKEADFMVTLKKIEAPAPAGGRRGLRQVAGHRRRHGRGAARRHPQEPRARGQVPGPGAQQGERDGRAGQGRRAGGAEGARRRRDRADDRGHARRPEEARREGRRHRADPGRDVPGPGREARPPRPGGRRAGAQPEPAGQAGAAAGAHRGAGAELREAGRGDALVPERPQAHGRGRGAWWSRTTSPATCSSAPR